MIIDDLDEIIRIEKQVFPSPWPRYFFEADIGSDQAVKVSAVDGERLVGYGLGAVAGSELHITNVAVDPIYHRKGIGSRLVKWLEKNGEAAGCQKAYLEVRVTNKVAIALYENLGYKIANTRRYYYLDGGDAYIMRRDLHI